MVFFNPPYGTKIEDTVIPGVAFERTPSSLIVCVCDCHDPELPPPPNDFCDCCPYGRWGFVKAPDATP